LSNNLPLWSDSAPEVLAFCDRMMEIAPGSLIETSSPWAFEYLRHRSQRVRERTRQWIEDNVFQNPQPNAPETSNRLRAIKGLAAQCLPYLKHAYDSEQLNRFAYEDMYRVMSAGLSWLTELHQEMNRISHDTDQDGQLARELLIDYNETQPTLKRLQETLMELNDWESDQTALPGTTFTESGRSMELEDDSELDADEEDDFGSELTEI